jgi:hypothetical protein
VVTSVREKEDSNIRSRVFKIHNNEEPHYTILRTSSASNQDQLCLNFWIVFRKIPISDTGIGAISRQQIGKLFDLSYCLPSIYFFPPRS